MRANESKSSGAGTVLLGIAAIALAGMVGTVGLIHQVDQLGPKVGDIVTFDPLRSMSRDMRAQLPAIPAEGGPGVACMLDVRTMHTGGGSLIIEAREPRPSFNYRVHWAGERSSDGGTDCGATADLLVSLEDVEVLAMAAGGFGVPGGDKNGSFWRSVASTQ
jgi:hypothetical protein